ncbi:hypothetical protein DFH09DRAFT_1096885 [Mycena vulgaris]|nr:hypothetical protein DFH09DRAFT_1096885 [Mycena vulgaris]
MGFGEDRMHGTADNEHEQPQDSFPVSRCACPIALRTLTHKSSIKFAPAESCACSNRPACRDGFVGGWLYYPFLLRAFGMQEERWHEARGAGMGTAGDAALEDISLSDTCLVHFVAPEPSTLLRERFELPLLCTPTVLRWMPGAFIRMLTSREAEDMVVVGESAERLSQQLELVPVPAAGRRSRIA